MAKMQNHSVVEKEIFKFLQHTFHLDRAHVRIAFEKLRDKLQSYEGNQLESRSFMYLDIISWLDSKIKNVPVQDIMREKYQQREKVRK